MEDCDNVTSCDMKVSRHLVGHESSISAGTDLLFCEEGTEVSAGFTLMPNLFPRKLQRGGFDWNFYKGV